MKMPPGLRVVTTGAADGIRRRLLVPPEAAPTAPAAGPPPAAAPGRRSSRTRLPGFSTGLRLALGALTGWFLFRQLLRLEEFLTLLLLSAFLAVSLEPIVAALCRRRLRRGWAVAAVLGVFLLLVTGFLLLVVPRWARRPACWPGASRSGWTRCTTTTRRSAGSRTASTSPNRPRAPSAAAEAPA